MKIIVAVLLSLVLCACATSEEKKAISDRKEMTTKAFIENTGKPLFKLTCPPEGCIIASLEISNPAAVTALADVAKASNAPQMSEGGQIALAVVNGLVSGAKIWAIGDTASRIFESVNRSHTDVTTAWVNGIGQLQPNVTTTLNSVTASGAGAAAAMGGAASATNPITNTTTTTTTTTNTNSGNRTATGGAGTTTGGAASNGP